MSLFECPECGFKDLPVWKACKWRRYAVYCYTHELVNFKPELVERLKEEVWIKEGPFWYKLTKDGRIVYRMLEMGKSEFQTHGFTEKPKDPFQMKLSVGSASPHAPQAKNFFEPNSSCGPVSEKHETDQRFAGSLGQGATGAEKPHRQNEENE